jgi:transcriptional regulator with GAF, ATPase, and Fis domain
MPDIVETAADMPFKKQKKAGPQRLEPPPRTRRSKSDLTRDGDRVKWEWERNRLLEVLKATGFSLTETARVLNMGTAAAVSGAIDRYQLREEYETHKARA